MGGGVAIYVRDDLHGHIRNDLSIIGLEAIWVETKCHGQTLLVGGFYRPPSANNTYFSLIEESFDRAYNTNIDNIIIAGDFNSDFMNVNHSKMKNLIASYNFNQVITDPTHFTENSRSLIDLIICKNVRNVLTSFVSDPFIPDLVRYHCPVVVVLKFIKPKQHVYKRHIWLYDRGDYENFRRIINSSNWDTIINPNDLESTANLITDAIINAAKTSIPNKYVNIRPNDVPWFQSNIRKLIRQRKRLHKKAKTINSDLAWAIFRKETTLPLLLENVNLILKKT